MVKLVVFVGVFEVVLYCYFFSKICMFDSLIEFIEDSLIICINLILKDEKDIIVCLCLIVLLFFGFGECNSGLICIFIGYVLMFEQDCL